MSQISTGARLVELRKKRCWTQQQMAEKTGVARSYIADVERGKKEPSFHFLVSLIVTTGVSADWLLGLEPNPETRLHEVEGAYATDAQAIHEWIDVFLRGADDKNRAWFVTQFERAFPEFLIWVQDRQK